jgi:hypothetical protein
MENELGTFYILYIYIFSCVSFIVLNLHNNIECNVKKLLYSSAIFLPIIVIKLVTLTPNFRLSIVLSTQYSTSLLCLVKINLHTLMYNFFFFFLQSWLPQSFIDIKKRNAPVLY